MWILYYIINHPSHGFKSIYKLKQGRHKTTVLNPLPWCEFICCERTGARSKTACDNDSFLSIPRRIIRHYFGMCSYVLRRELRQFIGLRMYPTQWFHLLQVLVLWQLVWQVHSLMSTPLWSHHDASDFLYLGIIWWTDSIQVSSNLKHQNKRP